MDDKKTLPMNDVSEIIARAMLDDERDLWVSRKRTPEPFDLPGIMDLLDFKNLSFDNHEYRERMADIVSVSANAPLYEVRISESYRSKVVFTSKLKYYVAQSDSVVNQSMNEVFALLEEMRKAGDNVKERKKQTEAAIRLVVAKIRHFLDTSDTDKDDGWKKDENWKNVVSSTPDLDGNRNFKEKIVFYHYMAAQIFRYQLELNGRYGYGASLDDIAIFYSEDLLRTPDTGIIDIVPAPDYSKNAAQIENARNDFGLCLNAGIYRKAILDKLITVLLLHKLILPEEEKAVRNFFYGHCKNVIHWQGSYGILVHFIKGIMKIRTERFGQLVTLPDGAKYLWKDVVSRSFLALDKDGKPCDHEKLRKAPNSYKGVTTALVKIFQDQVSKVDES